MTDIPLPHDLIIVKNIESKWKEDVFGIAIL